MLTWLLLACGPRLEEAPAADAWTLEGPGGPVVAFAESDLGIACSDLMGIRSWTPSTTTTP